MNSNTQYSQARLAVVLRALESVLVGCSDAKPSDVVLGDVITFNELNEVYEELAEGYTRIIRMPMDRDGLGHYVSCVAMAMIADAETMYDSTTYPGTVSDQIEREEAISMYTATQDILGVLVEDLELEVDPDDLISEALDKIMNAEVE